MDILVIAPTHADLPNASLEIAAIKRHHHAVIVPGAVRDRDIERAIEEGPFDVIWWISHGSAAGVLLSDGHLLSIDGVGQYVRTSCARLCVLNTCDSEDVAESIISGGNADMICTIGPVANQDAVRLGSLLAGELAASGDFHEAYEIVAPTGGPYRYLRAAVHYRRHGNTDILEQSKLLLYVLIVLVVFGGIGLYREIITVESNQARIIQNQEKVIDGQEKQLDSIRSLESRVIRLQLGMPGQEFVKDGP